MKGYSCTNCPYESMTKTLFCPKCRQQQFTTFTLPNEGVVYSFTTIRVAPPEYAHLAPYAVALIQMTDYLRLTAFIQEEVNIGDEVRWKETTDQTYIFEKVS